MSDKYKLIDLKKSIKNGFLKSLYSVFGWPLERFLKIQKVNDCYSFILEHPELGNFFDKALVSLGASVEVSQDDMQRIPKEGPLIIVSNHPYGGLDGIALGSLMLRVRDDFKFMANGLLAHMELIKPYLIQVNPFGGKNAIKENITALKDTIKFLKQGGVISTFPSGTVSHLQLKKMQITDPVWNENIANIARRTNATVLPVYIEGCNSVLFQIMGLIHPILRTVMLPREMVSRPKKGLIKIKIGKPISPKKMSYFDTDKELTAWFRLNTYMLRERAKKPSAEASYFDFGSLVQNLGRIIPVKKAQMQEIIAPINPDEMEAEINALPEENTLIKGDKISVYYAYAWQIKRTMFEIGRLREITFRAVGEGTGKSFDIDEFDSYYLHIFMWDSQERKIVGAYRVGRTDKIMESLGPQGLYTTTLFKIKKELFDKINPALEMGRSFITIEYQKKRSTLALLWRGIGVYVSRKPYYKTLFGPVSINPEYNAVSKDLIVQFLSEHKIAPKLSRYVKAKKPPKVKLNAADKECVVSCKTDVDFISALISEIEVDNKGIPTLLKHYLKLNGQILSFNVDPAFGNCLDGLIMVNLSNTDFSLLKVYMGEEQAKKYLQYQKDLQSKEAAAQGN